MIEGVVGLPGNGKSLYLVEKLRQARREGKKCYANFSSPDGWWRRVVWSQVMTKTNAVVVLDEAHRWFPARGWSNVTEEELGFFQQHRKAGLDLVWAAQDEAMIDKQLRLLTAYIHYVRRVGPLVIVLTYEGMSKRLLRRRPFWGAANYRHYWTEERVLGRNEMALEPVIGVHPNYCRYEDYYGHVRIVKRDDDDDAPFVDVLGQTHQLSEVYYRSPFSGRMVAW